MSNMSYCRFQNTLNDLQDVEGAIEEMVNGEGKQLSKDERRAFVGLLRTMANIMDHVLTAGGVEEQDAIDFLDENHEISLESVVDHINENAEGTQEEEGN